MKTLLTALCLAVLAISSGIATAGPRTSAPAPQVLDVAKGDINGW
jgi:hypothetical protein